jgi:hypothetical protein
VRLEKLPAAPLLGQSDRSTQIPRGLCFFAKVRGLFGDALADTFGILLEIDR